MDVKKELKQEIDRNRALLEKSTEHPRVVQSWTRLVSSAEDALKGNDKELQQLWIKTLQIYKG